MKNSKAFVAMIGIAFVIAIGAMAGRTANAATPTVGLGSAASFSVLAGTPSITNTGPTTIDRDIGIYPAASITGFPPGIVGGTIYAGNAPQAKSDLTAAYLDAAGRPVTANHSNLGLLPPLVGGVYNSGGATLDLTGTLTLDGANDPNSVWVFQATSDLITASASSVVFVRGGSPCNVFWQVTSSATLGSGSSFVGTILALDSITLANGVTVNGRALARNGLVSLINDTFITSTCNAPTVVVPPTRPPFTAAPSAAPTVTPTTAPTAVPIATTSSTVAPTAAPTAARAVAATKNLPATNTAESWSPLTMFGLALASFGALLLLRRPLRNF